MKIVLSRMTNVFVDKCFVDKCFVDKTFYIIIWII